MSWCGVKLRMVVVVEGEAKATVNDGVFVLRADDREDAFRRALEVGHRQEQDYVNGDGERVRWRFAEVLHLHGGIDPDRDLDGQEVMTELAAEGIDLAFDAELHPDGSKPASS
jgi:hypothetical protein